ncbi:zinc finger, SWIM-type containing protein, partial [Tanacetum coccineum]
YGMVFVPFTRIDNHLKCMNFSSRMLLREDTEAYTWLLTSFMTTHEKQPTMVVTDQDGAMKKAIEVVLTESTHRLCMWHIMQKVPATICLEIYDETDFKERFGKLVWNMFMEPLKFEGKWSKLVLRSLEDVSVECTCRHFLCYGSLCRHAFCVLKNRDIEVIPEKYILRRWRRDIIPHALRRNKNRYGEKNDTIEKLTNEANYVVGECLFLLSKDEGMLATFVEQLKTIKQEVQVQVPKPPSQKTGDVIEDIYAVEKPQQNDVNNPQRARNKGGRRREHRKSGREIALKAKTRHIRKCLCCGEKTNKHTKSTCPSNPKYAAKLARLAAAGGEQGTTTAAATKQATTTATAAKQGETTAAATEQATTTKIVSEETTNAS